MKQYLTGFFMAWGNFCALPCPCKRWDTNATPLMPVSYTHLPDNWPKPRAGLDVPAYHPHGCRHSFWKALWCPESACYRYGNKSCLLYTSSPQKTLKTFVSSDVFSRQEDFFIGCFHAGKDFALPLWHLFAFFLQKWELCADVQPGDRRLHHEENKLQAEESLPD